MAADQIDSLGAYSTIGDVRFVKRLSGNDTLANGAHQAGANMAHERELGSLVRLGRAHGAVLEQECRSIRAAPVESRHPATPIRREAMQLAVPPIHEGPEVMSVFAEVGSGRG